MKYAQSSENGQAVVLLVFAMVALLGFTALAIDGGMLYSERRMAQNVVDSASLAGALQKSDGKTNAQINTAILNSIQSNNYQDREETHAIGGPFQDFQGTYYLITVTITSTVDTSLVHFVYTGPVQNTVTSVARVRPAGPVMAGFAIVAMGNCVEDGAELIDGNGGGNSGGVRSFGGGIFLNSPESQAVGSCSMTPPNNGFGIWSDTQISSIGSIDYASNPNIHPNPIQTGLNGGVPIDDPLAELPEPQCTANGSISGGQYQPGNYSGSSIQEGDYAPGIYCIDGNVHLSGQGGIVGEGVVLYFKNGGITYTGNSYLSISAPNTANCIPGSDPGDPMDPTSSCTYLGIAIFSARNNTSAIDVRGNNANAVKGTVYAIGGTVKARGGGSDPADAAVIGQVISKNLALDGGGDIKVTYDQSFTFHRPARLSLDE